MGKPPLTDEERRIKDLTRELHEAAKEARQAMKNLQAELALLYQQEVRDALQADLTAAAIEIREGVDRVTEHLKVLENRMLHDYGQVAEAGKIIQDTQQDLLAQLAGFQSKDESARIFAAEVNRTAKQIASGEPFARLIAAHVIAELDGETAGEFSGRAAANFDIMRALGKATGGVTVRAADEKHPPGLYDEYMRPLDIRIVPLSV